jgi:UDP-glucose 4-epimerase
MKILVTGSEGFLGRRVCKSAVDRGHSVFGIDRVGEPQIDIERLDTNALMGTGIDAIIHCAAHADVRHNWENLPDLVRDNMDATLALLASAARTAIRSFVFISSSAVYADQRGVVQEDRACTATSPYAASKLAGEAWVQAYAEKHGWTWTAIRPAAMVGPGYHHGHIRDFVRQMALSGRIIALDNGRTAQPMAHVDDVADAAVECTKWPNGMHGIYNVASEPWLWTQTISVMAEMSGQEVPYTTSPVCKGWVGASNGFLMRSRLPLQGVRPSRPVHVGVRESLESLGWPFK